jgi:hypothetical protein
VKRLRRALALLLDPSLRDELAWGESCARAGWRLYHRYAGASFVKREPPRRSVTLELVEHLRTQGASQDLIGAAERLVGK